MEFLDKTGLEKFFDHLKNSFGLKSNVDTSRAALDTYVLNIDYDAELAFRTDVIVSGKASSAVLGVGQLGVMVLGNS